MGLCKKKRGGGLWRALGGGFALLALAACQSSVVTRGARLTSEQLNALLPYKSTTKTVLSLLGPPSSKSIADGDIWFYVSNRREERGLLGAPRLTQSQALMLVFDSKNVLETSKLYGLKDLHSLGMLRRITPIPGKKLTFLQQLLSSAGRF